MEILLSFLKKKQSKKKKRSDILARIIGYIDKKTIELLQLSIPEDTPIFIGDQNIDHMKSQHPKDYERYGHLIEEILSTPDYVALHPSNGSIQYIRSFKEERTQKEILVAVRSTANNKCFARSLFEMSNQKILTYKKRNALIPYKEKKTSLN